MQCALSMFKSIALLPCLSGTPRRGHCTVLYSSLCMEMPSGLGWRFAGRPNLSGGRDWVVTLESIHQKVQVCGWAADRLT